jgi:hypothetical protein
LYITFPDDAQMSYDLDRCRSQEMVFLVAERLTRRHDDRVSGMNSKGVKVFHVADRDAVIRAVPNDFIFHFLPSLERLFHENLGGQG